jgi:hypothetical protein
MRPIHVAVACVLLAAATAGRADEPWDLWEERMTVDEPLRMVFVGRFPSPQACNAKALELSSAAPHTGSTRLGYTCLPPESPTAAGRDSTPSGGSWRSP